MHFPLALVALGLLGASSAGPGGSKGACPDAGWGEESGRSCPPPDPNDLAKGLSSEALARALEDTALDEQDAVNFVQLRGQRQSLAAGVSAAEAASAADAARRARNLTFLPPIRRTVDFNGEATPGFVLEFSDGTYTTAFECIAEKGGLVTALRFDGDNLLVDRPVGPSGVQGAIFWPAPQSSWGWPPPEAFNDFTFAAEVDEANMSVTLTGPVDENTGLQLIKQFQLNLTHGEVLARITIRNAATTSKQHVAPWVVMRVPAGGLTFFQFRPGHAARHGVLQGKTQEVVTEPGNKYIEWFQHPGPSLSQGGKLFADPSRGWLAHSDGRLLLVAEFDRHDRRQDAPGEAELELYALSDYEEIEVQGVYTELKPGESEKWTGRWILGKHPKEVPLRAGDPALVSYVKSLVHAEQLPDSVWPAED